MRCCPKARSPPPHCKRGPTRRLPHPPAPAAAPFKPSRRRATVLRPPLAAGPQQAARRCEAARARWPRDAPAGAALGSLVSGVSGLRRIGRPTPPFGHGDTARRRIRARRSPGGPPPVAHLLHRGAGPHAAGEGGERLESGERADRERAPQPRQSRCRSSRAVAVASMRGLRQAAQPEAGAPCRRKRGSLGLQAYGEAHLGACRRRARRHPRVLRGRRRANPPAQAPPPSTVLASWRQRRWAA